MTLILLLILLALVANFKVEIVSSRIFRKVRERKRKRRGVSHKKGEKKERKKKERKKK